MKQKQYHSWSSSLRSNCHYYNGAGDAPAATSAYTLKDGKLTVPDLDRTFSVRVISNNNIDLSEPSTVVWRLLLVGSAEANRTALAPKSVEGVYNVKVVGEQPRYDETMTFENGHLSFVQNGSESISSDYVLTEDGILQLTTIGREYRAYANGDNLLFIGVADNSVWELTRSEANGK